MDANFRILLATNLAANKTVEQLRRFIRISYFINSRPKFWYRDRKGDLINLINTNIETL